MRLAHKMTIARPEPIYNPDGTITFYLTKGYTTVIDEADSDLAQDKWAALVNGRLVYAVKTVKLDSGRSYSMLLHRIIAQRTIGMFLFNDYDIDHANGNGLDNRRCNLRICERWQNMGNQRGGNSVSGYKGVYEVKYKTHSVWKVQIVCKGKTHYLGVFKTPEEAHEAYRLKAIELFGEFARWE